MDLRWLPSGASRPSIQYNKASDKFPSSVSAPQPKSRPSIQYNKASDSLVGESQNVLTKSRPSIQYNKASDIFMVFSLFSKLFRRDHLSNTTRPTTCYVACLNVLRRWVETIYPIQQGQRQNQFFVLFCFSFKSRPSIQYNKANDILVDASFSLSLSSSRDHLSNTTRPTTRIKAFRSNPPAIVETIYPIQQGQRQYSLRATLVSAGFRSRPSIQ